MTRRLIVLVAWLLFTASRARAATFTVNSVDDVVDANPGDGACDTPAANGTCTLRAAIEEANALGATSEIVLPAGTYTLMIAGQSETGAAGDLDVTGNLTITGAGAATTFVQACAVDQKAAPCPAGQGIEDRVFSILHGATATISGVTIRNGSATNNSVAFGFGGGIMNSGTLTLVDATVSDNVSFTDGGGICNSRPTGSGTLLLSNTTVSTNIGRRGGGIFNGIVGSVDSGTVTLDHSTVSDNEASTGAGGGILTGNNLPVFTGTLTLNDSVVSGNHTTISGGGILVVGGTLHSANSTIAGNVAPSGGGICNQGVDMTLVGTTVSGNTTVGNGAGILQTSSDPAMVAISASTISGNTSTGGAGGGIWAQLATMDLTDSTISGNTAASGGGVAIYVATLDANSVTITNNTATSQFGVGGGGLIGEGPVNLANTLLAGNLSANAFPDCSSDTTVTSLGFNLVGDGSGCQGITDGVGGDRAGTTASPILPRVAPLGNYGGETQTHALLPGSPAIDSANPAGCVDRLGNPLVTDQRGLPRSVDGNGDTIARCDVGAFEFDGTAGLFLAATRPMHAGNTVPVVTLIYGGGFADGMTAKLVRAGEPDVVGTTVAVDGSGAAASTLFDLTGRAAGAWDVIVTNPDATSTVLPGGFTVEQGGAPDLWVDVVGPKGYRVGRPTTFYLLYGNRGNADAFGVPIGISVPSDFPFHAKFPITAPPAQPAQILDDWSQVPIIAHTDGAMDTAAPFLLPVVPAGFVGVLPFTATATGSGPFRITFGVGTPYFQPSLDRHLVDAFLQGAEGYAQRVYGASTFPSRDSREQYLEAQLIAVMNLGLGASLASLGTNPQVYSMEQLFIDLAQVTATPSPGLVSRLLSTFFEVRPAQAQVIPPNSPLPPNVTCEDLFNGDGILFGTNLINTVPRCTFPDNYPGNGLFALDPNDKVGSLGAATFVSGSEPLRYAVYFENLGTATLPAQEVVVTDQLDTTHLDLTTLSLGQIAVRDRTLVKPAGLDQFTEDVDLRPGTNLLVRIAAALDAGNGVLTWRFSSIDPATGQPTTDPLAGFLSPNVTSPDGEGSVVFTVMPKPQLATGTQICNQAEIVFDTNAPIDTPAWCNVIDDTKPTSHVSPLAATQLSASFPVQWTGDDGAGSGVKDFAVFASENGGPFTAFVTNTTDTTATFNGQPGATYAFYSAARDRTGHVEDPHAIADTTTRIAGPLDHITISPASAAIVSGGSQAYTAEGFDAANTSLGDVTGATTFTITPDGSCTGAVCTATVAGSHTVMGDDAGKISTANLDVTATTTTSSSSSTTTTATPACSSQSCDDADPCTNDACDADGCHHDLALGFSGACSTCRGGLGSPVCAGAGVPPAIGRKIDRACALESQAEAAPTAKRRTKLEHHATATAAQGANAARKAARKHKHALASDCAVFIESILGGAE